MSGDLTQNFSRSEFACKGKNCCWGSSPVSLYLVKALQELSNRLVGHIGYRVPLVISSGFRCKKHNEEVQKEYDDTYTPFSSDSRHMYGDAADVFCPPEITVDKFKGIAETIDAFKNGGIGIYSNRLHLDVRGTRARWDAR